MRPPRRRDRGPSRLAPWILACGLASLAACGAPSGRGAASAAPDAATARIVVLAPAAAEMLDALGLADQVVAVGDFGPWPGRMAELPSVGGYSAPNLERILELDCDVLVTARSEAGSGAHERLRSLGVEVLALDTEAFDGVFAALETLGHRFGVEDRARARAEDMRRRLDAVGDRTRGLSRPGVLFVVGRDPLYVAGPGSHVDEMITIAGGANVAHDAASPYQRLSLEAALERMPEVIVDVSDNRPDAPVGRGTERWDRWPFLPAVRDDRVYHVAPGRLVIPGLRLPEMTRLLAKMIHPEVFGEPSAAELGPVGVAPPRERRDGAPS